MNVDAVNLKPQAIRSQIVEKVCPELGDGCRGGRTIVHIPVKGYDSEYDPTKDHGTPKPGIPQPTCSDPYLDKWDSALPARKHYMMREFYWSCRTGVLLRFHHRKPAPPGGIPIKSLSPNEDGEILIRSYDNKYRSIRNENRPKCFILIAYSRRLDRQVGVYL